MVLKSPIYMLQCSHVMAMSVQRLFPGTKVTIGPWIDRGFYYDFDIPQAISQDDLKEIKKEMQRIIKKKFAFVREEVWFFTLYTHHVYSDPIVCAHAMPCDMCRLLVHQYKALSL